MAEISVIVPIYNVEKYLRQCLDSIVNQTFKDIEIILIDDGSPDNCPKICDEYAKKDDRIKVIHKENGGYGQTMNIGLDRAIGKYIAIVEPDDYIDLKMYEDLYGIAEKYDSDIVKSCFYDNLQSKEIKRISKTQWSDSIPENKSFTIKEYPHFLYYHPSIWSCIYRKEFLNKHNIRFKEVLGAGWTDNLFQVQTMCLAEKINYTSKAYYYWRRLNYFESDALKDYTLPFKRSDEIHKWLEENNISDNGILVNLFRREVAYAAIVLGMKTIKDNRDCFKRIKRLISRCPSNFCKHENVKLNEIKTYKIIKISPELARFRILFKRTCKNLINIRLNKSEKRIILFGKLYQLNGMNTALKNIFL